VKEADVRRWHFILLVVAMGIVLLTSVATARPNATKQRVTIIAKGTSYASSSGSFVLEPAAGALKHDSGTESSVATRQRSVARGGQSAEVVTWVTTCKGKRGSFVFRARIEHVDAGNGYQIGTGTWQVVRGTGAYAGITGGGRVANATNRPRPWTERRDGFLTLP
jgi:hypothetical protein